MAQKTIQDQSFVTPNVKSGGIHIERLDRAACRREKLPENKVWIRVVITDEKTEQEAIVSEAVALMLSAGLVKLVDIKL